MGVVRLEVMSGVQASHGRFALVGRQEAGDAQNADVAA
jgi:hypothetical protein